MHNSNLKVAPGRIIKSGIPLIKLLASNFEIIFHKIEKAMTMTGIYSGIFDDDESILMKVLGHMFAFIFPISHLI